MSLDIAPVLAEQSEAEAVFDFETGAPAGTQTKLGMASLRLGGGVALSVREDPTNFWSKALGFGFDEPVTADLIGQIDDFYQSEGTAMATLQLAPSVLPDGWEEICAKTNLSAGSTWVKLVCDTEVALARTGGELDPDLRIEPVRPGQAAEWATTMMRIFEMPEEQAAMGASSVGRPGWHPYGVWADRQVVATATAHVHGDTAQFFGGSTLPEYRRRGAQTALIAARAQAAQAAGCRWLVAETGAEAPGTHNSSLHNLRRAGFEVLYERRNWTWRR